MKVPPRHDSLDARYRTTTQEIIDWATRTIADAPHRTLPILGLDLNDGVGL